MRHVLGTNFLHNTFFNLFFITNQIGGKLKEHLAAIIQVIEARCTPRPQKINQKWKFEWSALSKYNMNSNLPGSWSLLWAQIYSIIYCCMKFLQKTKATCTCIYSHSKYSCSFIQNPLYFRSVHYKAQVWLCAVWGRGGSSSLSECRQHSIHIREESW